MFVRKSTYEFALHRIAHALAELKQSRQEHAQLREQWNVLVRRINALGGERFLRGGERKQPNTFTAEEIRSLIQLCHPDKHGGKAIATEMTQKLLKMKEAAHG